MSSSKKSVKIEATELWDKTTLPATCDDCGLYKNCGQFSPRQLPTIGAPQDQAQILFVVPGLDDASVQHKQIFASGEKFAVLDTAMKAAGFPDDWATTIARFTSPLRCAGRAEKIQEDYCRDLFWAADILGKPPKIVVTLGKPPGKDQRTKKVHKHTMEKALGVKAKDITGRGRVRKLAELVGGTIKLKAKLKSAVEGEVAEDGSPVSTVPVEVATPDVWVMNVNSMEECLMDPGIREFLHHDISKLSKILAGTYQPRTSFEGREYRTVQTLEEAVEVFKYLATLDRFAYDIETGPWPHALDPYSKNSKILCVAVADPWRRVWVIPWAHKDSPLKDRVDDLAKLFGWVVAHRKKIDTWNGKFDNRWFLVKHGIHIESFRDGMLDRGLLDENKDKRLKTWAEIHTDLGYYDEELQGFFKDEKGKPVTDSNKCYERHVPFEVLCQYAAADADATIQLTMRYEKELHEKGLLGYSQIFTMPDVESTAQTEHEGVAIDWAHREAVGREIEQKFKEVTDALAQDQHLLRWRQLKAAEALNKGRLFWKDGYIYADYHAYIRGDTPLYSEEHQAGWDPQQVQSLIDQKYLRKRQGKMYLPSTKKYTVEDIELNLDSPKQLGEFIYGKEFLNLPITEKTETGAPATSEGVLKNNAHAYPVLDHINQYRKLRKWKSTYYDPVCNGRYTTVNSAGKTVEKSGWVRDDGLVHAEFLLTGNDKGQATSDEKGGTVTGRKSCISPNLQNQKSRGEGAKEIKKYFVSKHREQGGMILQADYSQLELRVFAVAARISWMIGRYQEGADLHAELAMELFQKTRDEVFENGGFWRACAKEFWFGPIYGESAEGIVRQLKAKHGILWNKEQGHAALDRMYARMPEFEAFKEAQMGLLEQTGEVRSVFGRRRFLPTYFSSEGWLRSRAKRQAINFLIQSAGSDMTSYAWILLNWWSRLMELRSRIVISVHDSLVWDTYPGEERLVMAGTKYAMENLPFSFVKTSPIPFLSDQEIGPSWGEIKGIEKLDEYKDFDPGAFDDRRLDPLRERCASVIF
jgi:DNA polymerase I-like protein with 3'-5' exonuclease and polymerase domains